MHCALAKARPKALDGCDARRRPGVVTPLIFTPSNSVILSGAWTTQSEVHAESKDPIPARATTNTGRSSLDAAGACPRRPTWFGHGMVELGMRRVIMNPISLLN